MVGKYSTLAYFLSSSTEDRKVITFSQIEEALHFKLPQSAYVHRPWWANDSTHVQARDGWLNSGWLVDIVDFKTRNVVFRKSKDAARKLPDCGTPSPDIIKSFGDFENYARMRMSDHFGVELKPGQYNGVPKLFDFLSDDGTIIGDAKYFTLVRGSALPPAKFSVIAEHVWLLEKTNATIKFLVFGNDERVPMKWLEKYGELVSNIDFYYITRGGKIKKLKGGEN